MVKLYLVSITNKKGEVIKRFELPSLLLDTNDKVLQFIHNMDKEINEISNKSYETKYQIYIEMDINNRLNILNYDTSSYEQYKCGKDFKEFINLFFN